MKLHLVMYMLNIAQDIKHFIRNYNGTNKSKFLIYSSDIVEKIQLSVEMMFELVYGVKSKDVDLFEKKKYILLILEIVREGFKLRELKGLSNLGYDFYMEKNVYLQHVLETNEEEYENKLQMINHDHFFQVHNKESKKLLMKTDKIEIPQKVLDQFKSAGVEFENNIPKRIVRDVNGNGMSLWSKTKSTISEYYSFFKKFLRMKNHIIELLYILRPLVYLSLMSIFKRKSFIPLIVNLVFDLIILRMNKKQDGNLNFEHQKVFSYEYMHRLGKLGVYLLREPIFSLITKPFIKKIMRLLRLPKFISDLVMVLLTYYTNVYFIL